MKPKDLKLPYTWENRRPLQQKSLFFVPEYYNDYAQFQLPNWEALFGNANPVCIEYCSGNGDWIIEQAKKTPEKNWVAVEIRFDRVRKIWSKMHNANISNLHIVCGEALTFTKHYVSTDSISAIYIHFPDPWPKKRHEKHRLVKEPFLLEMARSLEPGKKVTFVSDDRTYIDNTNALLGQHQHFLPPSLEMIENNYGSSWFEKLWREKGREIYRLESHICQS